MFTISSSHVTIMVTKMDEAINFYTSIGLILKQRWGDYYAMVEGGGLTIGLHPAGKTDHNDSVSFGLGIEDIEEVKSKLDELKISYREQADSKAGPMVHFKDSDGFSLYFIQSTEGQVK